MSYNEKWPFPRKFGKTTAFDEIKRSHSFIVAVKAAVVKGKNLIDMSFQGTAGRWDGLHFAAGEPPHPPKTKPRPQPGREET